MTCYALYASDEPRVIRREGMAITLPGIMKNPAMKAQTMNLQITHNGFHGYTKRVVRGTINPATRLSKYGTEDLPGYRIEISRHGAEQFCCRMADCKCGEGIPQSFWVRQDQVSGNKVSVRGHYPQS